MAGRVWGCRYGGQASSREREVDDGWLEALSSDVAGAVWLATWWKGCACGDLPAGLGPDDGSCQVSSRCRAGLEPWCGLRHREEGCGLGDRQSGGWRHDVRRGNGELQDGGDGARGGAVVVKARRHASALLRLIEAAKERSEGEENERGVEENRSGDGFL
ncbi:uncharacterized protein A4U43_C05F20360 [Asparagus officinalis]|uniref:Uncharacterized protein n=1 Tax=Asparagus officinalis TaxID=4686 RepID=A0A5P1EVK3_ASPOF|nr:uncharacterized protein A4U43_C05F20360 [Asparagus officinalis]